MDGRTDIKLLCIIDNWFEQGQFDVINKDVLRVDTQSFKPTYWSTACEREKKLIEFKDLNFLGLSLSPDGNYVLTNSMDQTARIWVRLLCIDLFRLVIIESLMLGFCLFLVFILVHLKSISFHPVLRYFYQYIKVAGCLSGAKDLINR